MIKYKVVSDSMVPLVQVGDELLLEKVSSEKLKRFDIIVFKEGSNLTCHYVWHINNIFDKGTITTRNLKNGEQDFPFTVDKVVGKVTNFKIGNILKVKILVGLI